MFENLTKDVVDNGGTITPLMIDPKLTKGTGLCNPSIFVHNNKIYAILRHVEYTLYCSEGESKYQSKSQGHISYYHREDRDELKTINYLCKLDPETLEVTESKRIDTSKLDVPPIWNFIGLEDARLVVWDGKFYACGVRRDTTPNGVGRMEMSLLDGNREVERTRIEPEDRNSYCEKNWMPINCMPYHFVKWTNPTEIVKVDLEKKEAKTVIRRDNTNIKPLPYDLRGGSSIIEFLDDFYLGITHEVKFVLKNYNGYKEADYYHRFVVWDKNWNIVRITEEFNFLSGRVEFCCGLAKTTAKDIIIGFGFQDNCSYAIRLKETILENIIWKTLKQHYPN